MHKAQVLTIPWEAEGTAPMYIYRLIQSFVWRGLHYYHFTFDIEEWLQDSIQMPEQA